MRALGLDIGTTTIEAAVLDLATGTAVETHRCGNARLPGGDPYAYLQDPEAIVQSVQDLLREIRSDYDAVGVTGQVHGILYYDNDGVAVSPLYTWLDKRSLRAIDGISPIDRLYRETGCRLPPGYGLATCYTNRLLGEVPSRAVGFTGILEYVTSRLADGFDLTAGDASCCASYGGYDPVSGNSESSLIKKVLGDEKMNYPQAVEPFSIAGTTDQGIPVAFPVGDNQAGFLAAVTDRRIEALISIGTSGQLSLFSESSDCPGSMELRPYFGLGYLHVGATLAAGKAYELIKELVKDILARFGCTDIPDEMIFKVMEESAASRSGEPLKITTTYSGTRRDPDRLGSIEHITLGNLRLGDLAAGTAEGVVRELQEFTSELGELFAPIERIIGLGNAMIQNELFSRTVEQAFDMPVVRSGRSAAEGAALAGAACAGLITIH